MRSFKSLTERNPRLGDLAGGRRRSHLRKLRRGAEGQPSGPGGAIPQNAGRGRRPSPPAAGLLYRQKFGDHIPLIRRQDVKGFVHRRPVWLVRPLGINASRKQAEMMEVDDAAGHETAARKTTDVGALHAAGRSGRGGAQARAHRRGVGGRPHTQTPHEEEASAKPPAVRDAGDPAGLAGADGRLGLDAGADLRHGVRNQTELGHPACRSGGQPWGGHLSMGFAESACPTTAS